MKCRSSLSGSSELSTNRRSPTARHHAIEQRVVDAQRVGERLAQPGGRLDVERQRAIAVLQVEVDQCDPAALPIGEIPGRVDRQGRRADAAARPDEGDQGSELFMDQARIARMGPAARQRLGQQLRVERLDDVVGDPGMQQITVEADLVAIADRDHRDPGLADIGELIDLRYRNFGAADVDDQALGRAILAEVPNFATPPRMIVVPGIESCARYELNDVSLCPSKTNAINRIRPAGCATAFSIGPGVCNGLLKVWRALITQLSSDTVPSNRRIRAIRKSRQGSDITAP